MNCHIQAYTCCEKYFVLLILNGKEQEEQRQAGFNFLPEKTCNTPTSL